MKNKYIAIVFSIVSILLIVTISNAQKPDKFYTSFNDALTAALASDKIIMVDFYTTWCKPCKMLDRDVFNSDEFKNLQPQFVAVKINAEKGEGVDLSKKYNVTSYPNVIFLDPQGNEIERIMSYRPKEEYLKEVRRILEGERTTPLVEMAFNQNPTFDDAVFLSHYYLKVDIEKGIEYYDKAVDLYNIKLEEKDLLILKAKVLHAKLKVNLNVSKEEVKEIIKKLPDDENTAFAVYRKVQDLEDKKEFEDALKLLSSFMQKTNIYKGDVDLDNLYIQIKAAYLANTKNLFSGFKDLIYDVGVKTFFAKDPNRPYKNRDDRPMNITLWYPVRYVGVPNMDFMYYLELLSNEEGEQKETTSAKQEQVLNFVKSFTSENLGVNPSGIDSLVKYRSLAHTGVELPTEKYPLITFYQGFDGSILENAVLCEYLASKGFFVVSFPNIGDAEGKMIFDQNNIETIFQDGQFAKEYISSVIKYSEVMVCGFSMGGGVAFLDAIYNDYIIRGVSLDPSITFSDRQDIYLNSKYYVQNSNSLEYLILNQHINRRNVDIPGSEAQEIHMLSVNDFGHYDFTSFGLFASQIPDFLKDNENKTQHHGLLYGAPAEKYRQLYQAIAEFYLSGKTQKELKEVFIQKNE